MRKNTLSDGDMLSLVSVHPYFGGEAAYTVEISDITIDNKNSRGIRFRSWILISLRKKKLRLCLIGPVLRRGGIFERATSSRLERERFARRFRVRQ